MDFAFSDFLVETPGDLDHAVAQISDANIRDARGIVLRTHATLWRNLTQQNSPPANFEECLKAVSRRAPGINLYLMPDGHSLAEHWFANGALNAPLQVLDGVTGSQTHTHVSGSELETIRTAELNSIFNRGKARSVICASENYHFSLPSGAHATQFIRLADAFTDIAIVDQVAYWLSLEIKTRAQMETSGIHALLVDHPSMLILAARAQLLLPIPLEVAAFPMYPSDVESRTATIELLGRVAARCGSVFVAIGVASTGRLANFIQDWAEKERVGPVDVIVLYAVQELMQTVSLCNVRLPEYKHYESEADCKLCGSNSSAVKVHSSSYLIGQTSNTVVPLPPRYFEQQKSFLQRWGHHDGVLRVHYDDPNEATARHHAYYIDVSSLLDISDFQAELTASARKFEPQPDVIVCPDHATARRLGKLIADAVGRPLVVLDSHVIASGSGPVDDNLHDANCALILDDVLITGDRLKSINRFLREKRSQRAPKLSHIQYWTVLATPSSDADYRKFVTGMTTRHKWKSTVSHCYTVPLPNWHDAPTCPWCIEQHLLTRLAQGEGQLDGVLSERIAHLTTTTAGVSTAPFYSAPHAAQTPVLGAESVVLHQGATAMQVLFACASAVQQLRTTDDKPLNADLFPTPTFMARNVLSDFYTERLIWLGLIRSLKGKELDPALRAFLVSAALDTGDAQQNIISGELAVAWALGKLGAIPATQGVEAFFRGEGMSWDTLYGCGLVDKTAK
ncbi:hypothetical protein PCA20602_03015 [Pandoraea capi]|uniref:Uncharacterized protein n=1 Tax=Pandoraea capi TaxID=2508286 RepID=A0ABY6W2T3_9BURK|nr:phosphoribosyltransferase [Pandoraea capi]VVE18459.1 hypothetical protein PCA20602_03015 [Pandoraea capi]